MGGGYEAVSFAVKNMIANPTGMMCDGAKPSCSLKLMTGVSTAVLSAMLAMENHSVSSVEGIIDDDVDKSIRNPTLIGRDGMNETDHLILEDHDFEIAPSKNNKRACLAAGALFLYRK